MMKLYSEKDKKGFIWQEIGSSEVVFDFFTGMSDVKKGHVELVFIKPYEVNKAHIPKPLKVYLKKDWDKLKKNLIEV